MHRRCTVRRSYAVYVRARASLVIHDGDGYRATDTERRIQSDGYRATDTERRIQSDGYRATDTFVGSTFGIYTHAHVANHTSPITRRGSSPITRRGMQIVCVGVEACEHSARAKAMSFKTPALLHEEPAIECIEVDDQIRIQLATRAAMALVTDQKPCVMVLCKVAEANPQGKRRRSESEHTVVYAVVSV